MTNSPARSGVDVGALIADTYTLEALIGRGGMGSVFLASHTRLPGKKVAIKFLHFDVTDDAVIARFKREAEIATHLNHPNIVRVDDFNVLDDGTPYLILELLEGESLADRLTRGAMPLDQVLAIVRMVGSAIAAAHREGIVHRDLKPQNIFLVPTEIDGQLVETAKVLDFGISKMRGRDTIKTQESTLLGTPQYMAPEQATGQHSAVDARTDVFALGAIVYEMLTGKPAFSGENIPEVVFKVVYEQPPALATAAPDVPAEVVAAVERAMQKQQADRFATVGDFVEALTGRPLVQRSSLTSMPPGERRAPTAPSKRSGQVAFANTIDSGSTPKPTTVSPHAATVASQDGHERTPTAPPMLPIQPRPKGLLVALAGIALLAIGAAVFFATRGSDPTTRVAAAHDAAPDKVAVAARDADAVVDDAEVVAAVEADADVASVPADAVVELPDAAVAITPDAGTKKPPNTGKPVTVTRSDDPKATSDLARARETLAKGNHELAYQLCNAVLNSTKASELQHNQALLIRGEIYCKHRNDISNANADHRAMTSPSFKRRLALKCGL